MTREEEIKKEASRIYPYSGGTKGLICDNSKHIFIEGAKWADEHPIDLVGEAAETNENDIEKVNHPKHYNSHPSGIECIEIVRHYNFDVGNAIKYLWRHGLKHEEGIDDKDKAVEDLEKAIFYINDEIKRIKDTE